MAGVGKDSEAKGAANKLTDRMVRQAIVPGLYPDGLGLFLQVTVAKDRSPRRSWIARYTAPDGRRREAGLGKVEDIDLATARDVARNLRKQAKGGEDPLEVRKAKKLEAAAAKVAKITFKDASKSYIDSHETSWSNPKHGAQWRSTLETYVYPVFGAAPVDAVNVGAVMAVLEPLWSVKTETASRVRGRIELILDWAIAREYRSGPNPARWRGGLDALLPKRSKVKPVQHHSAMPHEELPELFKALRQRTGSGADCLAFTILSAARSGEAREARWSEIDLEKALWTIPAKRMKARREHRVPLPNLAVTILKTRAETHGNEGLVFASDMRPGKPLSDATLTAVLRRLGRTETVHGFRATFRMWAAERSGFSREVVEMALAHTLESAVEAAYQRSDLLARRRELMAAWADYLATTQPQLDQAK